MGGRIFISHSTADSQLGCLIVEFLQAMIEEAQVAGSSLPGHVPEGGEDSLAALKGRLAEADVVIGVITPQALASGEVPFQLGAAWSLGTRLLLLLEPDGSSSELYLPMGHAETLVLGPEALIELARSLAQRAGLRADMGAAARDLLARLFPDYAGLDRESSEHPVAQPRTESGSTQPVWPVNENGEQVAPSNRPPRALPSCSASLQAGRAVSDCVFHRQDGEHFADELDLPFGVFLAGLGADWSALREIDDLDVWVEAAENLLGGLGPSENHVRYFYEIGFQLSTLINLANSERENGSGELGELWESAWTALREAAQGATIPEQTVEELRSMLENLSGPSQARDFANLGRVQERVGALAAEADAATLAASA